MITNYCEGEDPPRHCVNIIVLVLVIMVVVFMMWKNQPVRVGFEDLNSIKLQKVEREK